MDFKHILSKPVSIHLVMIFMMVSSAMFEWYSKINFITYFSNTGYFHVTYALSLLSVSDRETICNKLGETGIHYESTDVISLVRVLVLYLDCKPSVYPIPTFLCVAKNGQTMFYTTYVPDDQYYKLVNAPPSMSENTEIITILSSSQNISLHADSMGNIQEKTIEYFKSEEYKVKAENVLRPYYQNETWKDLCSRYYPKYKVPDWYVHPNNSSSVPTERILVDLYAKIDLPVIKCPLSTKRTFYILYFVDGIFISADNKEGMIYDGMTSQHYNNLKESLRTVLPTLHRIFPREIVNCIRKVTLGSNSTN